VLEESYDARVLDIFVDADGRLLSIPAQHKRRLAVLRWLADDFQPGLRYPEAEVNRIISRRHPDFATLRRYLVDEELIQRRRSIYWRTGTVPNVGHDPASWPDDAQ
jgi:hypothetical protein